MDDISLKKGDEGLITEKEQVMKNNSTVSLYAALGVGILAVSTAAIFIRYAQAGAASLVIAALRMGFSSLLLAPVVLFRYRNDLLQLTRRQLGLALLAGCFLALHFALWISSLEYTSVASSVVLVTTTPLWVALASPFLLKEALSPGALAGMGVALLGGAVVAMSDACVVSPAFACPGLNDMLGTGNAWGNFLSLAGAWMAAGYLMVGRRLRSSLPLVPYIFMVYSASSLALLAMMALGGKSPLGLSLPTYFWIFLLALIPQLLGHSIFNWALRFLPASFVAVNLLGEPIGSTILAFFLLSETPSALELAGGCLILLGIYLASQGNAAAQ